MNIKFTKMQAYGNDYVYINAITQTIIKPNHLARVISDRHFGVGSDGLVLICASDCCLFRMRMFNPDGSEGEMCGNALRSLSKYVYHYGLTDKTEFTVETLGGIKHIKLQLTDGAVSNISANIGKPVFDSQKIPVNTPLDTFFNQPVTVADKTFLATSISWGNPHTVIFTDSVDDLDVALYGSKLEHLTAVFPKKTNVTFAQIVSPSYIKIREWERGTGETLGCGTGCCTAVVAGNLLGKCQRLVKVEQPGGILEVEWDETGYMHMHGPSQIVYEGEFYYEVNETA